MPPKSPQFNYTKKPVRRLRLPKIGPPKTKGFFEEYFYACLVSIFLVIAVVGKAGGLSGSDALVVGAWIAGFLWMARLLKGYYKEKSKTTNGKTVGVPPQASTGAGNGQLQLPPGMKPMIGPQWPLKSGPWPARPRLGQFPTAETPVTRPPVASAPATPAPTTSTSTASDPAAPRIPSKPAFIYERPTLPDRKPKLPHNWQGQKDKKPKQ